MSAWPFALTFITALFCVARGVADIRQRRYAWGVVGLLVGLAVAIAPLTSLSIKVDLPPASR
jgi:hypothetical protein